MSTSSSEVALELEIMESQEENHKEILFTNMSYQEIVVNKADQLPKANITIKNEERLVDTVGIELDTKGFEKVNCKEILFTEHNLMVNKTDQLPVKNEYKIHQEFNCDQDIICYKCGLGSQNQKNLLRHQKSKPNCL